MTEPDKKINGDIIEVDGSPYMVTAIFRKNGDRELFPVEKSSNGWTKAGGKVRPISQEDLAAAKLIQPFYS